MDRSTFRSACLVSLILASLWLVGCGSDPDHELQRAQLALSNNRPDQALHLAASVLKARPNDPQALMVRAQAQLSLLNFKGSHNTLNTILKLDPRPEADIINRARDLLRNWAFAKTFNLLRQTDFDTSKPMQEEFDEALAVGEEQAQWLWEQPGRQSEAALTRGRLVLRDAARVQRMLDTARKSLANLDHAGNPITGPGSVIGNLTEQVKQKTRVARRYLEEALELNPQDFEAAREYARFLRGEEDWAGLWSLAAKLAQFDTVPESLAGDLVLALLQMPASVRSVSERVEVGWQLQNKVSQEQKKTAAWRIASARLHLQAGEHAKAQPLLEEAAKTQQRDLNIPYLLAQCYAGQGQYARAKEVLDSVISRAANNASMQLLYGSVLVQTGDRTLAKEALRRATELDPNNSTARQLLLGVLAEENQLEAVAQDVDKLLTDNPEAPNAIRLKLQFEQARGGREAIATLLERVEQIFSLLPEHMMLLVDGYNYLQKYDKSEQYARRLTRAQPDAIESHLALAGALMSQGKDDQVRAMLAELRTKFPRAASIDQLLGRLYLQRQRYDSAQEALERVVEAAPTNIEARLMLSQAFLGLSMPDEALEQVLHVIELQPTNLQAHSLAASVYQTIGNRAKADEHLVQVDENKVSERDAPLLKAQLLLRKGDRQQAAAVCNRAIAAGRTDPMLRRLLAAIYLQEQQPEQAEFHLLALVRAWPNDPSAYAGLTQFYLQLKWFDRGLSELAKLQTANEPMSRLGQASLLTSDGRLDRALGVLEPILEPLITRRDPSALAIVEAMGRIHFLRGKPDAAEALYNRLIQAGVMPLDARLSLIDLKSQRDGPEKTLSELDELAKQLTPESTRVRLGVLRRYQALRRHDRVLSVLNQWIAERPDSWRLLQLKGRTQVALGRAGDAVTTLLRAVELAPDNLPVRMQLAAAHMSNFDFPAAEAALLESSRLDTGARITSLSALGEMFVALGLNRRAAEVFEELESVGRPTDPRVLLAVGHALSSLGRNDQAAQRLGEVPDYAPQYVGAQILLSRIEQGQNRVDEARARLERLSSNSRHAAAASRELLRLGAATKQTQDLLKWCDQTLSLETLSDKEKDAWLRARVWIAADGGDWNAVSRSLDRLVELNPGDPVILGSRVAVLLRLGKTEEAKLMLQNEELAASDIGRLLTVAVGQPERHADRAFQPLDQFLVIMARQDLAQAASAIDQLPPLRSLFKDDLRKLIARPDAGGPEMATAFRNLIVAAVGLRTGLPQLTNELTRAIVDRLAGMAPAYSLMIDATAMLNQPTRPIRDLVAARLPGSSIGLLATAQTEYAAGSFAPAVEALRALMGREPDNVHLQYMLVSYLQAQGDFNGAIALAEQIWNAQGPYRFPAGNDLAYLLTEHQPQRLDDAFKIATQCIAAAPASTPLLDTIGWIEHKRGEHRQALERLSRAISPLKALPEVHFHIGSVYQALGNAQWARYHLNEAAAGPADKPETSRAKALLSQL